MKTFTLSSEGVLARYDYLSRLSPDRWAWEYARRNPDLRRDAEARSDDDVSEMKAPCADIRLLKPRNPQRLAHRWGLMFMPDPDLNGFEADAVWNKHVFPDQVEVNCSPRAPGESCDIWDSTVPICQITHITDLQAREGPTAALLPGAKPEAVWVVLSGAEPATPATPVVAEHAP